MSDMKKQFKIYLPPDLIKKVKLLAIQYETSYSGIVELILRDNIDEMELTTLAPFPNDIVTKVLNKLITKK